VPHHPRGDPAAPWATSAHGRERIGNAAVETQPVRSHIGKSNRLRDKGRLCPPYPDLSGEGGSRALSAKGGLAPSNDGVPSFKRSKNENWRGQKRQSPGASGAFGFLRAVHAHRRDGVMRPLVGTATGACAPQAMRLHACRHRRGRTAEAPPPGWRRGPDAAGVARATRRAARWRCWHSSDSSQGP
jgi:hypothetical protein